MSSKTPELDYHALRSMIPWEVLRRIFELAGQKTTRAAKCVCRYFNEVGNDPWLVGLTPTQRSVIASALKVTSTWWRIVGFYDFPARYNITCGTGTGKTLIAMFIIKRWVEEGRRVLLALDLSQMVIWMKDWQKWSAKYKLPAISLYHQTSIVSLPKNATAEEIERAYAFPMTPVVIVSKAIHNGQWVWNTAAPVTPNRRMYLQMTANIETFSRGFTDECRSIPGVFRSIARGIGGDFFALNLNATKGVSSGIGSHTTDADLPVKPQCYLYTHKRTTTAPSAKWLNEALTTSKAKRILICYDSLYDGQFFSKMIGRITHSTLVIKPTTTTNVRQRMLDEFTASTTKRSILIAPARFIAKGHNVYPDEIYYYPDVPSPKVTFQLIGRAHRHGAPWSKVRVHVIHSNVSVYNAYHYAYSVEETVAMAKRYALYHCMGDTSVRGGSCAKHYKYLLEHREELAQECKVTVPK